MGGGSTPSNTTSTVTQSNLPAYAQPYYTNLMQRAGASLTQPYQPYGQQRVAGFTDQQKGVQGNILSQQTPGQFNTASGLGAASGLGSLMASQYNPSSFSSQQIGQPNLQRYQAASPQNFGQAQADQYMSPYAQSVMDVQKRNAITDAKKGQLAEDLGAARQGTYGGSRQLLASMERERNLGNQLGDIQATGQQAAYTNAQQQFNADRAAGMDVGKQNLDANLQTQQLGTNAGLQALMANQTNSLDAQKAAEQSHQFGSSLGLQGLAQANQSAQTLSNIGTSQSQSDLARLGQQQTTAAQQQALNQQMLDTAYQDFLAQRNYGNDQLQFYSGLLHGVPVTNSAMTTQTATQAQPSVASQILGTGLGALGAYKALAA